MYLYTDGANNGRCSEDFARQLVDTFNGQTQDYPYLSAVYIDLNEHSRIRSGKNLRTIRTVV